VIQLIDNRKIIVMIKERQFEWDENKRQTNIVKHGIDFLDVQKMFNQWNLESIDKKQNYDELRYNAIGLMDGRVVVVSYTYRNHWQTTRIISARKATKHESRLYYRRFPH
jgi:hypothetical protein